MSKNNPVVILEDDPEDQELIQEAFKELGILNPLRIFSTGDEVLNYLRSTHEQPFIILSDINLPGMNGLELREEIDKDKELRKKSIPFLFFTTASDQYAIEKAYELTVQGYFVKENMFSDLKATIKLMVDYWSKCKHPNS
jgi:CheY-like chemotaxis protein